MEEDNEKIIFECIKEIFAEKHLVKIQDISDRIPNIHYNTILKYISILEAKGKIIIEIIGTAKVIIGVDGVAV